MIQGLQSTWATDVLGVLADASASLLPIIQWSPNVYCKHTSISMAPGLQVQCEINDGVNTNSTNDASPKSTAKRWSLSKDIKQHKLRSTSMEGQIRLEKWKHMLWNR